MLIDLLIKNRSYRKFYEEEKIERLLLEELIECARLSPSGANLQPLKFFLSNDIETNDKIFPNLAWAGYIPDWSGPKEGEKPSAYIVILLDKKIAGTSGVDHGIAAQSILLGAVEQGLGGCMIGSLKKTSLAEALDIPEQYEILLVLALGKPREIIVLDDIKDQDVKYWRDDRNKHHVPKRRVEELIFK
jgi:nitroreductase